MLFYDKKNETLFACLNAWDPRATMMRIQLCEGEALEPTDTTFAAMQFNVTASRAGLIDIDKECIFEDVAYRLDLAGMRIKHLAPPKSTKIVKRDGTPAMPGMLSWQTWKKFDALADMVDAWYQIISQSAVWDTLEPYNPPTKPNGAIIRQRPDDADPGEQESGETVEGELLPPCKGDAGLAVAVADDYAVRVGELHQAAQQHATASVLCAAIAGAMVIFCLGCTH